VVVQNSDTELTMNKLLVSAAMGIALASGTASVQAAMTLSYGQSGDTAPSGAGAGGGEFNITPGSGWGANPLAGYASSTQEGSAFRSFCLEKSEYTSSYPSLNAVQNSEAVGGGTDNTDPGGTGDPISKGTAWLYSQFASGTLAVPGVDGTYNYTQGSGGRDTTAGLLQQAIWALEDEETAPVGNPYYDAAMSSPLGGKAAAPSGYLGVYALNITHPNPPQGESAFRQDMLYYAVPEPSTWFAGLGALGLMAYSAVRRQPMTKVESAS